MSDLIPNWDPYDELIALRDKNQILEFNQQVLVEQVNLCMDQVQRLAFAYTNLLELYQALDKKIDLNQTITMNGLQQLKP